jgi:hypothetical protein
MRVDDFNTQDHWSKTKKGRAMACKALGIEPFITQSVRQQHQPPSDTVLDNAVRATLAAVWIDCESQGKTASETRRTIWKVMQTIDAVLEKPPLIASHSPNTVGGYHVPQPGITGSTLNGDSYDWFDREFGDVSREQVFCEDLNPEPQELQSEPESTLMSGLSLAGGYSAPIIASSIQQHSTCAKSNLPLERGQARFMGHNSNCRGEAGPTPCSSESTYTDGNAAAPTVHPKRKRVQSSQDKNDSTYRSMLDLEKNKLNPFTQDERTELAKFLEYPLFSKLDHKFSTSHHFLYLTIGSRLAIEDYKSLLRLARSVSDACDPSSISNWSAAETYKKICCLEKEEALHALRRRYHTMQLCGNENKTCPGYSQMIVETPRTVDAAGRARAGNPKFALDARLTNELLRKIMPNTQDGSGEFEKARRKVKQLRKLARYLYILVDSYGFGILALLPSGPSFGELSLTDTM